MHERQGFDRELTRLGLTDEATNGMTRRPELDLPSTSHEIVGRRGLALYKDTAQAPYRWICSLKTSFTLASGRVVEYDQGTGVLIADSWVLTVAHNLLPDVPANHPLHNRLATKVVVTPGRDGGNMPFGVATSSAIAVTALWQTTRDARYDYGVIKLNRAIGTDTFRALGGRALGHWGSKGQGGPAAVASTLLIGNAGLRNRPLILCGYPSDTSANRYEHRQYRGYDVPWQVPSVASNGQPVPELISYLASALPGHSGSPVWVRDSRRNLFLVALHRGGCETFLQNCRDRTHRHRYNFGVRITRPVLKQILTWMDTL